MTDESLTPKHDGEIEGEPSLVPSTRESKANAKEASRALVKQNVERSQRATAKSPTASQLRFESITKNVQDSWDDDTVSLPSRQEIRESGGRDFNAFMAFLNGAEKGLVHPGNETPQSRDVAQGLIDAYRIPLTDDESKVNRNEAIKDAEKAMVEASHSFTIGRGRMSMSVFGPRLCMRDVMVFNYLVDLWIEHSRQQKSQAAERVYFMLSRMLRRLVHRRGGKGSPQGKAHYDSIYRSIMRLQSTKVAWSHGNIDMNSLIVQSSLEARRPLRTGKVDVLQQVLPGMSSLSWIQFGDTVLHMLRGGLIKSVHLAYQAGSSAQQSVWGTLSVYASDTCMIDRPLGWWAAIAGAIPEYDEQGELVGKKGYIHAWKQKDYVSRVVDHLVGKGAILGEPLSEEKRTKTGPKYRLRKRKLASPDVGWRQDVDEGKTVWFLRVELDPEKFSNPEVIKGEQPSASNPSLKETVLSCIEQEGKGSLGQVRKALLRRKLAELELAADKWKWMRKNGKKVRQPGGGDPELPGVGYYAYLLKTPDHVLEGWKPEIERDLEERKASLEKKVKHASQFGEPENVVGLANKRLELGADALMSKLLKEAQHTLAEKEEKAELDVWINALSEDERERLHDQALTEIKASSSMVNSLILASDEPREHAAYQLLLREKARGVREKHGK